MMEKSAHEQPATETRMSDQNPYVGPRSFQTGEKLYGREHEVEYLFNLLVAERIVLFYSPSGAGKSSLVQAGLLPRLESEGFRPLPIIRVGYQPDPDTLAEYQQNHTALHGSPPAIPAYNRYVFSTIASLEEDVPQHLRLSAEETIVNPSLSQYLDQRQDLLLLTATPDEQTDAQEMATDEVFIFDQFEEVLTLDPTDQAAKIAFFEHLGDALRHHKRWAIFSIREDYVGALAPYTRYLPTRLKTTFRLDLLGVKAAHAAITGPASEAGVSFATEAATHIVNELRKINIQQPDGTTIEQPGPSIEPVQLQVVCHRLWQQLEAGTTHITLSHVRRLGDVNTALADYYADSVAAVAHKTGVRERVIREWFENHLITPQDIRGQVLQEARQSQGLDNRAIWPLIDAHLVRAEKRRGATWFELAHDRLIAPVRANNAQWFAQNLSTFQRQVTLWESEGRPDKLIPAGDMLNEAIAWGTEHYDELNADEQDFLQECQQARTRAEQEAHKNRRIRHLAIAASVVSAIALVAFILAIFSARQAILEKQYAQQQQRLSASRELASEAINTLEIDPELSILLGIQAIQQTYQTDGYVASAAFTALQHAINESRTLATITHKTGVYAVAFNPDGTRLATASENNTASLWDISGNVPITRLHTLSGHTAGVTDVEFSPDGTLLATASEDGTARLWDATSGEEIRVMEGHTEAIWGMVFSADGTRLATGSDDDTARIWDIASGQEKAILKHPDDVNNVAFHPNGLHLATACMDDKGRVWSVQDGEVEVIRSIIGIKGGLFGIDYNPAGTLLAFGSGNSKVVISDVATGKALLNIQAHKESVARVHFSPDGKRLATASLDGTAQVWKLNLNRPMQPAEKQIELNGHTNWLYGLAFSQDGTRIATASLDGTARIWDASNAHAGRINGVAYSPDGQYLATVSSDRMVKIWQQQKRHTYPRRQLVQQFREPGEILNVAYSPDGELLATANVDGKARLWNIADGTLQATLESHTREINDVAFSPDGTQLATASRDQTVKIWDIASGEELQTLTGHTSWVTAIAYHSDGKHLATSSDDGTARLWDIAQGQTLFTLDIDPHDISETGTEVKDVLFSADETYLFTASTDQFVRVWDAETGDQVSAIELTANPLRMALSNDGKRLATANSNLSVTTWNIERPAQLQNTEPTLHVTYHSLVNDLAYNPNGEEIATVTADHKLYINPLEVEALLTQARTMVTRSLRPAECQQYLYTDKCPTEESVED
jgi:WD40 repeat protein